MAAPQMQLEDWLDDLCVRFIINLPQEDLSSVARICFQVEEAQWFYEDFIRPLDPTLPSMSLRTFCLRIFQHCPLLASFSVENHTKAFEEFLQYKTRVPVRGAIMLNHAMDSVLLVKGWKKGANWSFPRGKINKDEDDLDCAVREVYEETGLDLRAAGLVPTEKKPKYIEISMREQQLRLYVFRDIPMDTKFQPRTRKEISKIQWYKLSELPAFRKKGTQNQTHAADGPSVNKFYMVAPFLVPLKKWIHSQKKFNDRRATSGAHGHLPHHPAVDEVATTEDDTWAPVHDEKQSHVPAIETLDGATQELQRLLKMQPPTQGLQSPPQKDKGTALLSILQSSSSRQAPPTHQNAALPQTPLNAAVSEPPQPQNPHHQANFNPIHVQSHQPPPCFPYAPDHRTASRNPPPSPMNKPHLQHYHVDAIGHQQPGQHQLPSAHSQPPPLQVQGSILDNGSFQNRASPQQVGTGQNISPGPGPGLGSLTGQQDSQMSTAPGSVKLSGASLALLNAFKRDIRTGATGDNQEAMNSPAPGYIAHPGAHSSPYFNYNLPNSSRSAEQTNVSELAGPFVQPRADPHRTALLDMFKKNPSNPTAKPFKVGDTQQNQHGAIAQSPGQQLGQAEPNTLLQQFQANCGPASEKLSLQQLFIQSRPNQPTVPSTRNGESPSSRRHHQNQHSQSSHLQQQQHARSPLVSGHGQQPQPPRILQRGQRLDDIINPTVQQRETPPKKPPIIVQNGGHGFPAASPELSSMASAGDSHRRPDHSRQQKQQLLSLFGKEKTPGAAEPVSGTDPRQGASLGSSRVSSRASRGGETQISPAEQSFLLGYLQSVTNNAGR
ncbi:mRNA decapping protein 2, Box A [Metarhizium album ARSEF 1941]|uniref:mRNA decapping protein 2, Box A n=1 Tax=Metarhizium album (strain ARSEF 1941) TaxID=1081103 RepID=A0A0B2X5X4_METAS|nr:mRNA decapping protein 2, Box A [Metarhizium album ARSEF 1941]KHO00850.1 mRNA decapping protein 2, Box A [Metarhizium album ARSEF 1941]